MAGEGSPAVDPQAPTVETVKETPNVTTSTEQGTASQTSPASAGSREETASPSAQPAAPVASEPDIDTILQNEAHRKRLREKLLETDPELRREMDQRAEHKFKSPRQADIDARAREIATQMVAEEQQKAAIDARRQLLQQRLQMDPVDRGEAVASDIEAELQTLAAQEQQTARAKAIYEAEVEANKKLGGAFFQRAYRQLEAAGASPDEIAKVNPQNFDSLEAFQDAVDGVLLSKRLDQELKKRLPPAVEARVQEKLASGRETEPSPAVLPAGGGVQSDRDFMADFAAGKNNDFARAKKVLASG